MTAAEKHRRMNKLTMPTLRSYGVGSVLLHQTKTLNDLADANDRGLTFAGNRIADVGYFSDWIDTGQFRYNLRFADTENIDLTSNGEGFDAIRESYDENDYIAPSAEVLSAQTITAIKSDFINNINNTK